MKQSVLFAVLIVFIYNFSPSLASEGDRSPFYENCVKNCRIKNCTEDGANFTPETAHKQDFWAWLVGWQCRDECRYHCMWRTVDAYQERGYPIPKFHGKWPFRRVYGVQEPGSALASGLNLAAHVYMYHQLIEDYRFCYKHSPMIVFWHFFFCICTHAWAWSTVFHARDTPFTEFMDYACALSMVMILFIAAVIRLLFRKKKVALVIVLMSIMFFIHHVRYLYSGKVDYEYNMTVNIVIGMLATALWMVFSLGALCGGQHAARRYVWRLVVFCKLSGAAVLLELFDFPPYLDYWDAHALWHLSTAPLPLLFYKFVMDDLDYMAAASKKCERSKSTKTDYKIA
ncbi:post-GPI attachment to proteins factor 3 [Pectinophora gossypiella]|nr:post-GPI attachment to proteins factor 3 [Pectinophora gossypiella]